MITGASALHVPASKAGRRFYEIKCLINSHDLGPKFCKVTFDYKCGLHTEEAWSLPIHGFCMYLQDLIQAMSEVAVDTPQRFKSAGI